MLSEHGAAIATQPINGDLNAIAERLNSLSKNSPFPISPEKP